MIIDIQVDCTKCVKQSHEKFYLEPYALMRAQSDSDAQIIITTYLNHSSILSIRQSQSAKFRGHLQSEPSQVPESSCCFLIYARILIIFSRIVYFL